MPSYTDGFGNEKIAVELAVATTKRPGWKVLVFPSIPLGSDGANEIGDRAVFAALRS